MTSASGRVTPWPGLSPLSVRPWRLCGLTSAGAGSAVERLVDGVEHDREGKQVAVIDAAVVELTGEVAEQPRPVLAPGSRRNLDLHASLDDLNSGPARRGRTRLLRGRAVL